VIRRLGGVSLSVLLHAGLIALLLVWSAVDRTRPLFVDLSERAPAQGSPETAPVPAPRPAPRAAGSASVPSRAPARPEPVAAEIPGAPPVAPTPPPTERMVPVAPPAPTPAAEPVPAPAAAPVPVAPALPSGSSVASAAADTRVGADTGAGSPSGAPSRGDGDRGPGGGPGAPLALAAPGASGSGAPPAEYGPYLRRFRQRVQESLVYPLAARRQGLGGTVELHVWLEATGRVRDVQIARSSSHDVLDEAAVQTIRRLGLVPFPDSLPRRPLLIRIPLVYELR
jgi:protein TonB